MRDGRDSRIPATKPTASIEMICFFFLILCTACHAFQLLLAGCLLREPKRLFAERQYGALLAIALTPLPIVAIAAMWATLLGLAGNYDLVGALHRRTWLTTAYLVAGFSMLPMDVLFRSRPSCELTII